jgi:hypothetical protein
MVVAARDVDLEDSPMPTPVSNDDLAALINAKVRRRILPLLMLGWFVAYIDRFNVSYAALQMTGYQRDSPSCVARIGRIRAFFPLERVPRSTAATRRCFTGDRAAWRVPKTTAHYYGTRCRR